VVSLALLGLLIFGIQNAYPALTGSDLFQLQDISVVGNRLLTEDEVVAQCGLAVGMNLFQADLEAATEKIRTHPVVQRALLQRQPPETLVITVRERAPIALVSIDGELCGLEWDGSCFPLPQAVLDLPVVTGLSSVATDSAGSTSEEVLREVAGFVDGVRRVAPGLLAEVSEMHLESIDDLRIHLVGSAVVLKMGLTDSEQQSRNYLAYAQRRAHRDEAPAYVDLRFEDQVVVGMR
jgi:cell division protein FtsQ